MARNEGILLQLRTFRLGKGDGREGQLIKKESRWDNRGVQGRRERKKEKGWQRERREGKAGKGEGNASP
jgi:hypothetical protein